MEVSKLLTDYGPHLVFVGGCALQKGEYFSNLDKAAIGVAARVSFVATKLLTENYVTKNPWVAGGLSLGVALAFSCKVAQRLFQRTPRKEEQRNNTAGDDTADAPHSALTEYLMTLVGGVLAALAVEGVKFAYSNFYAKK